MPDRIIYAPLWCKSNYSFLKGASFPEQYVSTAAQLGLPSIALTDIDGLYGIVKAHLAAVEHNIHLIVGSQITVNDPGLPVFSIVLLVRNRIGYANLCSLITIGRLRCEKGRSEVTLEECCQHSEGLYAIWLPQGIRAVQGQDSTGVLNTMRQAFGEHLFMMVCRHRQAGDPIVEARTRAYAQWCSIPTVAAQEVLYHDRNLRPVQDILSCIRQRQTLADCQRLLEPNACHELIDADRFKNIFRDDPASVEASVAIARDCDFRMDETHYIYPEERDPDGMTASRRLRDLARRGALQRYSGNPPKVVSDQIEKELELIRELGYSSYFLTMHRIVRWCSQQNIMCQGRGSAANSAVCYCLGITHIDPVDMDLLFERFMSRERDEPPDIDLDIEHERREEVIQYVYRTYGRDHAAMVAVVIRYRSRSAIRDVGTALSLPEHAIQRLSKQVDSYGTVETGDFERAGLDPSLHAHHLLKALANAIVDYPRHLSIHPGGFVFASGPIYEMIPVENATMPERTVIQWEKDDIEAMRIFKIDLLGLGALTQLHRCFDLIANHRDITVSMDSMPKDDEQVFKMLCEADTTGVFQIESRAQMSMLPRLKPRQWYDLVVQIAIVRPGPISGGMVHPYLRRRAGEEPVTYPHPCLVPVLGKTLGIPIFQEQVIKLAMVAADYQPGEADQLRRDMAAWRRTDRLEQHREKLISRMTAKGIEQRFAEQVFNQIRGFGEYGFPESHSASFALIAYAASYMKCHYPAEFACSLLNSQPMGFYSPATIVEDARRHGVRILPIDVLRSQRDCTIESDPDSTGDFALRIGLRYVKGINSKDLAALAAIPRNPGSIEELIHRTGISKTAVQKLAEAGAFRKLSLNRRTALWAALGAGTRQDLIPATGSTIGFAPLSAHESTTWDYQSTGVSSSGHMLRHYRQQIQAQGLPDAAQVSNMPDGCHVRYVGIVICRQRPSSSANVVFMTLEDETGFVNAVFWPRCFDRYSALAKSLSLMGIEGTLQVAENVVHLIVEHVWEPTELVMWKNFESRNFH
ncbi:MAG: error-prone DNA polymerase [Acidiferrobacterales bacterium]|nr:error-prone DNA polymerase [Acidiferrobacterales bacterium]